MAAAAEIGEVYPQEDWLLQGLIRLALKTERNFNPASAAVNLSITCPSLPDSLPKYRHRAVTNGRYYLRHVQRRDAQFDSAPHERRPW